MEPYAICYISNLSLDNVLYTLDKNIFSFIFRDECEKESFCIGSLDNISEYETVKIEGENIDDPLVVVNMKNITQDNIESIRKNISDSVIIRDEFSYGDKKWDNPAELVLLQINEPRVCFIKDMKIDHMKILKNGKGLFITGK